MQNSQGHIKLEIPVEFEAPRSVIVEEDILMSPISTAPTSLEDKISSRETLVLSVLPPLLLHVILPPSYPLHSPPEIVSLRATHMWIPNIQILQTALIEMWQSGEQVLYNWVEYIRTGEFLETIKLTEDSVIMCVSVDYSQ
jgi:E3 ubiquitin-protein ligase RNF14